MSPRRFEVVLDNPLGAYVAGEQVTGRVLVRLEQEQRIRGIELRFLGEARVQWTESRTIYENGKSRRVTDYYHALETYIRNSFFVVGGATGEIILPPGEYVYPFVLILSPTIPSSFEGTLGQVRYSLQVIMIRPWKFNHKCKVVFTILCPVDLNYRPHLQVQAQQVKEKYLCCLCCETGPISIVVTTPYTGFVPGQKCHITLEVDNPTTSSVTSQLALCQVLTYTASCGGSTKSQVEKKNIIQMEIGTTHQQSSKTWATEFLIPSLPPSFLSYCDCIDLDYIIVVTSSPSGIHRDATINIPVVVGNIPFRTHFSSILPHIPLDDVPDQLIFSETPRPEKRIMPSVPFSDYPDMPPPTYAECVSGRVNIQCENGAKDFAPVYPTYHFR